jgi:hypothetical protein
VLYCRTRNHWQQRLLQRVLQRDLELAKLPLRVDRAGDVHKLLNKLERTVMLLAPLSTVRCSRRRRRRHRRPPSCLCGHRFFPPLRCHACRRHRATTAALGVSTHPNGFLLLPCAQLLQQQVRRLERVVTVV